MLILSQQDIENYATSVLNDFLRQDTIFFKCIDIERLAVDYLGMKLKYMKLSDDNSILGLTTYNNIIIKLEKYQRIERISIPKDTIIIEENLLDNKYNGCRRFSIAHECAHQILVRLDQIDNDYSHRFVAGTEYSLRELTTTNDWREWQANTLGAALLMPEKLVSLALFRFGCKNHVKIYGRYINKSDRQIVKNTAVFLGVSFTALLIRLKQLNLIDEHSCLDYKNPMDIII